MRTRSKYLYVLLLSRLFIACAEELPEELVDQPGATLPAAPGEAVVVVKGDERSAPRQTMTYHVGAGESGDDAGGDDRGGGSEPAVGSDGGDDSRVGSSGEDSGGGRDDDDDDIIEDPIVPGPVDSGGAPGTPDEPPNPRLWPMRIVPYTIDPAVPSPSRIGDAIAHWQANTSIRFVRRTNQAAYVTFTSGTGCSSYVGRQGAQQFIRLASHCHFVAVVHEIGHAVGLYHEQCRTDRDQYVKILTENILANHLRNFDKQPSYTVGSYHYDSVMHYRSLAFSKNGLPTIVKLDGGLIPANETGLTAGDVDDLELMYRNVF